MIRSMTGFGAAAGPIGSQQVTLELRTVNHRFFNPSIKLPTALSQWEGELREQLRKGVARGHVTAVARIERAATGMQEIDEQKVARYADLLRGIQQRHKLDGAVDLATILRFPDVLASEPDQEHAGTPAEVQRLAGEAIDALTRMREVEGTRLAALLEERITTVEGALSRIAARAPERLVAERERLKKSVKELTEGVDLDQQAGGGETRPAGPDERLAHRSAHGNRIDAGDPHPTASLGLAPEIVNHFLIVDNFV